MRNLDFDEQIKPTNAVIYCRVSSVAQTTRGDGLGSQETRCREFAGYRRYNVVKVFKDDLSGSVVERPGMRAMLAFLKKHRNDPHAVLIDEISRLARGMKAHMELRSAISMASGVLESPTLEFGEDADSELQEYILATVSQHQRRKNAEQTLNRMRSRLLNGYWVFWRPLGYCYEKTKGEGKMLVRDEPVASILQEALEGFASGRFETKVEVKRFLESQALFPKDLPNGEIRHQRVEDFLTQPLYAGYVHAPNWNIGLREGRHEGLISLSTYEKIQHRLKAGAKAPARKDLNLDFPLRGFIKCGDCDKPLTACWSKSKTGAKHPYYLCYNKSCESHRKSIRRDDIEGAFNGLLKDLQPTENLFSLVRAMFKHEWDERLNQVGEMRKTLKASAAKIEKQIDQLLDRIVEASNPKVISAYEKRIASLEQDKLVLVEKHRDTAKPKHTFEEMFELAMNFLSNPYQFWNSDCLENKRIALRLTFSERLSYCRKTGFSNPEFSLPFKALSMIAGGEKAMARRGRFELPTPRFVV
jgi:site-specific DNA recombinase